MRRYPKRGPEVIELWDYATADRIQLTTTRGPVHELVFSADGRYLLCVGGSSTNDTVSPPGPGYAEIHLFDVKQKKLIASRILENHSFLFRAVFLPNSKEILSLHQNYYNGNPKIIRIKIIESD
jgi:hypothetical protein